MRTLMALMDGEGRVRFDKKLKSQIDDGTHRYRNFRYLCEAGYLKRLEGDRFEVTDLTKINLLKDIVRQRKPDGRMRIVMFDIPEKLRTNRNVFRHHLVELGFRMRQQSVWVSSLPCEDLVTLVVKYHGLGQFVDLVIGESVPIRKTAVV